MGKKRYNWKARNVSDIEIDNTETKKIPLDIEHRKDNYDNCNALVLPNKKRYTKNKEKKISVTRILSKKRRKQLEKIVEKKQKKLQRSTLLEELAKVQAPQEELKKYVSLTAVQTKGLKRHFRELNVPITETLINPIDECEINNTESGLNAIKGGKRKRLSILNDEKQEFSKSDLNTVGFDYNLYQESSENESECSSNECENKNDLEYKQKKSEMDIMNEKNLIEEDEKKKSHKKNINLEEIKSIENEHEKTLPDVQSKVKISQNIIAVNKTTKTPAVYVTLNRKAEIQAARLKLPVVADEQVIVETINENSVVIITGETGSGKTTQVPQFLYEAGYAKNKLIGITEPRRVAAMSMSKRVAEEMNLTEKEVSYLIRFEGNVTPETKIKFMTDGVLLKEIQSDFLLTKYSVIILDEAHERSVYTDILIGLLSRIVPLRNKRKNPLKLIIMSATLCVEEFVKNSKLFKVKPPVITVESRQFPVTIHFNRRTSDDYVTDALRKAIKIHTRLPEGGILIFLTGQQEVNSVVRKLRKAFPFKKGKTNLLEAKVEESKGINASDRNEENSENDFDDKEAIKRNKQQHKKQFFNLPRIDLDNYSIMPTDDTHEDVVDIGHEDGEGNIDEDESEDDDAFLLRGLSNIQPLWVLPLYSLLPSYKQAKVFERPPENCRLCVVSTNVAETSLTIPNIKYVIDCGRCKMRMYDKVTGVSTYNICYISKAAANQRAGRSGRTAAGHCYRLYSSAVFNDQFAQFSMSEIQRKPIDDLVLQMKVMNINKVVNFPFPTAPDPLQLRIAETRLLTLGALEQFSFYKEGAFNAKVTPLGRSIAAFPVAPRYGKMLALSYQHNLLQYTICMVAALSVQEVLIEGFNMEGKLKNKWLQTRRIWAGIGNSLLLGDPMVLIKAIGATEYAGFKGKLIPFCEENGLRHKAIVEIKKLRQQLTNEINLNVPNINLIIDPSMSPPTDMQAKLLRQILLAGMADQVARKVLSEEIEDQDKAKWKYAYKTVEMEDPVFMHSSCVLRKTSPEWVVYQEIYETNKLYMRGVTAIEPEWLPKFAPTLCTLSEPLIEPSPRYDLHSGKVLCHITGTFGRAGWQLPMIEIEYPMNIEGVKWFARFFLEGEVCPKLKRFVPILLSTPGSVNKSWAKLLPRTEAITKTLLSEGVMSKCKLIEVWDKNKTFLLFAYQKWLPESTHSEMASLWPPI
ncbi:putative ATP-dependent RNA helicase kurz [Vespula squamosa]|uniref:RNA helicase n=1 Tax=Vespula squamosa TaxID=30214 RepID=A0ABD2AC31_VESSQ